MQGIIGTDKKNPYFSIYRNVNKKEIHVFYGISLFEIISETKDNPQLKLLAGRLYNANVKASIISRVFGYCYRSIRNWGEAIKTGDMEKLVKSLEGQGAPKKLTKEIEGFVSYEFRRIYLKNKHSFSQEIRQNIAEVFNIEISAETLRPLFNKFKAELSQKSLDEFKKKYLSNISGIIRSLFVDIFTPDHDKFFISLYS